MRAALIASLCLLLGCELIVQDEGKELAPPSDGGAGGAGGAGGECASAEQCSFPTPICSHGACVGVGALMNGYHQHHNCAALTDGRVRCWGFNQQGEVGAEDIAVYFTPIEVEGITDVIEVSSMMSGSCALRSNGEVWCWGNDGEGQITGTPGPSVFAPTRIEGVSATQLATGTNHACGLQADGQIICWGANNEGALGHTDPSAGPRIVEGVGVATQVEGCNTSTCALHQDGFVKCWGRNAYGQLGDGTIVSTPTPVNVLKGPGDLLRNVVEISCAQQSPCAILSNDEVWCWGINEMGMFGNSQEVFNNVYAISGWPNHPGARPQVGGWRVGCTLHEGKVWCAGRNYDGELGNNECGSLVPIVEPVSVIGIHNATDVAYGWRTGCVLRVDGRMSCWGQNLYGQAGPGHNANPTLVAVDVVW